MLKDKHRHIEPGRPVVSITNTLEISATEETLRIRRELVNAAIEVVGYDPLKIEAYLNRKSVA